MKPEEVKKMFDTLDQLDHSAFDSSRSNYVAMLVAHRLGRAGLTTKDTTEVDKLITVATAEAHIVVKVAGPPASPLRAAFMELIAAADKDWYAYQMMRDGGKDG